MLTVDIIIRCRNASEYLRSTLDVISKQRLTGIAKPKLIVVDNESVDSTVIIARGHGAEVVSISRRDFSWGKALNLGIAAGEGQIVFILSADATPANDLFFREMLAPFADELVAAVYGRQEPRDDAPIEEVVRLKRTFGPTPRTFSASDKVSMTGAGMVVSNACATIRRACWNECHYDELISGGEEGIWTSEMLSRGWLSCYQPSARVLHSHRENISRYVWRQFELFEKHLQLTNKSWFPFAGARHSIAIAKRRILACAISGATVSKRVQGAVRLPAEVILFLMLWLTCRSKKAQSLFRPFFWG